MTKATVRKEEAVLEIHPEALSLKSIEGLVGDWIVPVIVDDIITDVLKMMRRQDPIA